MKIARYLAHGQISYGAVEGDSVKELSASPFEPHTITDHTHKISEVQLLAPCEPTKVLAVGLTYSSHLHDRPAPAIPMIIFKTPNSVIGPGETIIRPKGTEKLDAEAELVIVVKDRCHKLTKANAFEHILGYTCGNDVSARDWQRDDRNWWRAKSSDTFTPLGPYIVTDLDPSALRLIGRINGKVVQEQVTSDLLHDVPTIMEFVTRVMTLNPGDVVMTGTPGRPDNVKEGDVMEVEIAEIGTLSNPVVNES
jgi:2-keto-4-pentenoate hydratase/2-oxohepta-3-ene-1,7-dioic acid hydratase in catechol pathway